MFLYAGREGMQKGRGTLSLYSSSYYVHPFPLKPKLSKGTQRMNGGGPFSRSPDNLSEEVAMEEGDDARARAYHFSA